MDVYTTEQLKTYKEKKKGLSRHAGLFSMVLFLVYYRNMLYLYITRFSLVPTFKQMLLKIAILEASLLLHGSYALNSTNYASKISERKGAQYHKQYDVTIFVYHLHNFEYYKQSRNDLSYVTACTYFLCKGYSNFITGLSVHSLWCLQEML